MAVPQIHVDPHGTDLKLIPVIDIMGGLAVWARGGQRGRYAPLLSRLCSIPDPVALAERFRTEYGTETLYIADLDAITGDGDNHLLIQAIAEACPGLELWIDAGLGNRTALCQFLRRCPGRPVIGSETLVDKDLLTAAPKPCCHWTTRVTSCWVRTICHAARGMERAT